MLARLHSECFTGDLLGSLRCDCGDQLRGAIEEIAAAGAGVLIYLAQEGRGIGLVNKLRAYKLQDAGLDTVDANEQLGFDADERIYLPAAEILRELGFATVRLMTNNPEKVEALARCGIEVAERVPTCSRRTPTTSAICAPRQPAAVTCFSPASGATIAGSGGPRPATDRTGFRIFVRNPFRARRGRRHGGRRRTRCRSRRHRRR